MLHRLFVVVVALSLSACELFGKPQPEPAPGPMSPSPRLADWKLPFTLAEDLRITDGVSRLNYESNSEVGPQVGLSLFTSVKYELTKLVPDSVLAVAALPDRVVVIFPQAPDGVMTIAQGGLDRPWVAQPLDAENPVLRWQVGALDAVAAPDGSVLIAVRLRPFRLVLYRWATDGTVTKSVVPAQGPLTEHWSTSRCPDVRLDASEAGGVVIARHAGKRTALSWRKPGASQWTEHLTPPLEFDDTVHFDMGCTNRVVLDDSGFPQLLTLVRTWSRRPTEPRPYDPEQPGTSDPRWNLAGELPIGLAGRTPPLTGAHGYKMLANGALSRSAEVARPSASLDGAHAWHNGFFAFDRHPGGWLISGPNVDWQGGTLAHIRYRVHDPVYDSASPLPTVEQRLDLPARNYETSSRGVSFEVDPSELRRFGDVEHLAFEPCGDVMAFGSGGSSRVDLARNFTRFTAAPCAGMALAPVQQKPPNAGYDWTPAFAHGRRPYEVGVCAQSSLLGICHGGYEPRVGAPLPEATTPTLVASQPPSGPVALDVDRVTFTLSRAVTSDERVFAVFHHVNQLEGVQVTPQVDGAVVTVPFPRALTPGSTYRVALLVMQGENQWLYLDGGAPVATFTTAKSAGVVDARLVRTPFRCPGVRVGGVCELTDRVRGLAGQTDDLGFGYDFEAQPLGPPSIYDAQNVRVADAVGQVLPNGATRFTWGTTLARDARYELRYPPGVLSFSGTEFLPEDLTLAFRTRAN